MPAHSGVSVKSSRAAGSQMPCSQMMSMNISPPRATAERNVDSVPNVNARMRNSGRRNIGSAGGCSTTTKVDEADDGARPSSASTRGLPQPIAWPPAGRIP